MHSFFSLCFCCFYSAVFCVFSFVFFSFFFLKRARSEITLAHNIIMMMIIIWAEGERSCNHTILVTVRVLQCLYVISNQRCYQSHFFARRPEYRLQSTNRSRVELSAISNNNNSRLSCCGFNWTAIAVYITACSQFMLINLITHCLQTVCSLRDDGFVFCCWCGHFNFSGFFLFFIKCIQSILN